MHDIFCSNRGLANKTCWFCVCVLVFVFVLEFNTPWISASLCLNSRILQKLILTIFVIVYITFINEQIFRGLFSTICVAITHS